MTKSFLCCLKIMPVMPETLIKVALSFKSIGNIYTRKDHRGNLFCEDIEIDYKAEDLTFETILNLFRGRYSPYVRH